MGTYNFVKDLERAKLTEKEAVEVLAEKYGLPKPVKVVFSNKEKGWDFAISSEFKWPTIVEVKEDISCVKTGNVAIEVESRGKPSGIITTSADTWFIKAHTPDDVIYFECGSRYLKHIVETVILHKNTRIFGFEVQLKIGGDAGSNTVMVLLPLDLMKLIFTHRYASQTEWVDKGPTGNTFVFGSNLNGNHLSGSAAHAVTVYGAEEGVGAGPTGFAYAIPTLGKDMKPLPLSVIAKHVANFKKYATVNPYTTFDVVAVGCGVAGFTKEEIAPLFFGSPKNVYLPDEFDEVLTGLVCEVETEVIPDEE